MPWTTPETFTAGQTLTAASMNLIQGNLTAIGDGWTSFVPTLSGGWALGNATYTAKYVKAGKLVVFYATITVGSTTTIGTTMNIAYPVTAADKFAVFSAVEFQDTGSGTYVGLVSGADGTASAARVYAMNVGGSYASGANITSTIPFTWAATDVINIRGVYEAAS